MISYSKDLIAFNLNQFFSQDIFHQSQRVTFIQSQLSVLKYQQELRSNPFQSQFQQLVDQ